MLPLTLALPSLAPLVALPAPQASASAPGTLALGGVDVPLACDLDDVLKGRPLLGDEFHPVQRPPEVPVGRVQQSHE